MGELVDTMCFVGGDLNYVGCLVLLCILIGWRKEFEGLTLTILRVTLIKDMYNSVVTSVPNK